MGERDKIFMCVVQKENKDFQIETNVLVMAKNFTSAINKLAGQSNIINVLSIKIIKSELII